MDAAKWTFVPDAGSGLTNAKPKIVLHPEHGNVRSTVARSTASRWVESLSENYMTNRERLQLVNLKIKVIKYPGENFAIFGKNEVVKILLRKAKGEKVKYNAA